MLEGTFFTELAKELNAPLLFEGLWESPKAFLIHAIHKLSNRNVIVITSDSHENTLYQDLAFFQKEEVLELPSWEALPGEEVPPSRDIMGKRLEVLHTLLKSKSPQIVLTSLQSFLQKVVSKKTLDSLFWSIQSGQEVNFEDLVYVLSSLGYERTKLVDDKGKFAVRGGIIDVFPISEKAPYRIEFFGNQIESLRLFDPMSQRSVEKATHLTFSHADEYGVLFKEKHLETLTDYLEDPIIIFEDLLSIEDHFVKLKSLSGFSSRFFLDFPTFLKSDTPRIYFSDHPLENLQPKHTHLEFLNEKLPFKRHHHPFAPIDIEHLDPSLSYLFLTEGDKEREVIKANTNLPNSTFISGYLSSGNKCGI